MKNYVIIGNGVAGVSAAKVIRENDSESSITIVSKENANFYYRPRLVEYLTSKVEFDDILVHPEKWYEEKNIKCTLGMEVVEINKENKEIVLESGEKLPYTKLLIANGADPFILPVSGVDKKGIFCIKDKEDVDNIKEYLGDKKRVVIIGGGVLGIEAANGFVEMEKDVTIVEFANMLLPRQLDKQGSYVLEKMLESKGIKFLIGESTKEIVGENHVEKVLLNSGKVVYADLVIFSVGVKPRKELAEKSGLEINKGILVNKFMQTSDENIYAAGDVAESNGICYGLWIPSKEQGEIAGKNITSENVEAYEGSRNEVRLKVAGINVFSAGKTHGENLTEVLEETEESYVKKFEEDGKLVGAIIIGDIKEIMKISKIIN